MTKEQYLKDPCKASSLPFWKTQAINIPESIGVIRDDLYTGNGLNDSRYFKLIHHLSEIVSPSLPKGFVICDASIEEYMNHINQCYEEEGISVDELHEYKKRPTYDPNLWIAVKDVNTNEIIATIIGEADLDIKEGIIEWAQVSSSYRRKGIGIFLVNLLLSRMELSVDFVTVSGRMDSSSHPIKLYLSCGFVNPVIWHILEVN